MFTGIIREIGIVKSVDRRTDLVHFEITCPVIRSGISEGDSVAIDGCDLTATGFTSDGFLCTATLETLNLTTLSKLVVGSKVNLETSLTPSTPISGHLVLGHIDGVGTVRSLKRQNNQAEIVVQAPKEILKFIARKGSVTIAGVGLTVVNVASDAFSCWIIPYTLDHTTLGGHQGDPGAKINIEVDVLSRYVFRALESGMQGSGGSFTEDFLREHGFG